MTENELPKPNPHDKQILDKIEEIIGQKLEQVPEIEWHTRGYVINHEGQIAGLGLYGLGINDKRLQVLSERLIHLKSLTTLYLRYNNLTDISILKELPKLTTLDLSSNNLTDISILKELPKLTTLDLGSNNLTDISILKELPNLTSLNLQSNQISIVPRELFESGCLGEEGGGD